MITALNIQDELLDKEVRFACIGEELSLLGSRCKPVSRGKSKETNQNGRLQQELTEISKRRLLR